MHEDLEKAVAEVADLLAATAIDGWARLIWRATLFGGSFQERLEVVLASGATRSSMGLLMENRGREAIQQLSAALRAADGHGTHAVELTVEPGQLHVVTSPALGQSTGYLPPTYRVVADATPPRPPTDEPVAAQGDPSRIVELAKAYAELYADAMGEQLDLRPPATEDEITAAEKALGVTLPAELRALYLMADGEYGNFGLFGGPTLLPLARVVEMVTEHGPEPTDRVAIESHPPGVIRPVYWHPRWIPFANHNDGNLFAVDLAPGPEGTAGQVITCGRDYEDEPVTYVSSNVTDLLAELVDMLRAGDVDMEPPHTFGMFPSYCKVETPAHSHYIAGESFDDWLAGLSDPNHVQQLHLRGAGTADLTAFSRLRILHIDGTATGLENCPLEQFTGGQADLDGHPTVRILDLSAAEVTDIGVVNRLPALRHLTLNADQWSQLPNPPQLATAALTGVSSLETAATWARQFVDPGLWQYRAARH